jgi:flavin-dependent thymidylate synthase
MKVSLIDFTGAGSADPQWYAAELLAFTKSTRLQMSPGLLAEIRAWPRERLQSELDYMANTIPSSWEFVNYTFLIEGVSRAFTHQFVRTRTGSYAQQTMRVLNMCEYEYVPTHRNKEDPEAMALLQNHRMLTQATYKALTNRGQAPEDARGILPTNIATNIVAQFDLRALSGLTASRTGGRTQGEYRDVMSAMADAVLATHPWAERFLFPQERNYFAELEAFAEAEFGGDLLRKGRLLKIVDGMRKERS